MGQMKQAREARSEAAFAAKDAMAKLDHVATLANGLTEKLSTAKLVEGRAEARAEAAVQAERDASLRAQGAIQARNTDTPSLLVPDDKSKINIAGELTKGSVNVDKTGSS
jgi:hypothetical protein